MKITFHQPIIHARDDVHRQHRELVVHRVVLFLIIGWEVYRALYK